MATVPVFRTWVAGEVVTAAYFNSNVRDAGNFFLSWPVFEGRQTVAQSIANNAPVNLTLDTEDIDTDNGHNPVTNATRYTFQTSGRFQVSGGVSFASNATGVRGAEIWETAAAYPGSGQMTPAANGNSTRLACRTISMFVTAISNYVEIVAFQTSGGAINSAVSGTEQPTLSARMVGTT